MLFNLDIKKANKKGLFNKVKNLFMFNRVNINLIEYDFGSIANIELLLRRGRIPWKKIMNFLGNNKKILCSDNIFLPPQLGICRYTSNKLNIKLCKNAVLEILKLADTDKENLKIVLYDPCGNHVDFLSKIVDFSRNIIVITDNKESYLNEQLFLLREYGVSILITDNRDWTYNSNIVVAPEEICEALQVSFNATVFTGEKTKYNIGGRIYDKYEFLIPTKYEKTVPTNLTAEYFFNVLYDQYELEDLANIAPEFFYYHEERFSLSVISDSLKFIPNSN